MLEIQITSKYGEISPFTVKVKEENVLVNSMTWDIEQVRTPFPISGISKFKSDMFTFEIVKEAHEKDT